MTANGEDVSAVFTPAVDGAARAGHRPAATATNVITRQSGDDVGEARRDEPLEERADVLRAAPRAVGVHDRGRRPRPPTDADCDAPTKTTWSYQSPPTARVKPLADPASIPADVATTTVDGEDGAVRVRTETGRHRPRHLHDLDARPRRRAPTARWDRERLERTPRLPLRRRVRHAVHARARRSPAAARRRPARPRLRGRDQHARHVPDDVQRRALGRSRADDARALRRGVRRARSSPSATVARAARSSSSRSRTTIPGILDALVAEPAVPRRGLDRGAVSPTAACSPLLRDRRRCRAHATRSRPRSTGTPRRAPATSWNRLVPRRRRTRPTAATPIARRQIYNRRARPEGRALHARRHQRQRARRRSEDRLREPAARQRRRAVRPARRCDDGAITVDQFLDLNERIGGYDIDGNFVAAARSDRRGDRRDRVQDRCGHRRRATARRPDHPAQRLHRPVGDIHTRFHSFSIRDRLQGRRQGRSEPRCSGPRRSATSRQRCSATSPNSNDPIDAARPVADDRQEAGRRDQPCTLPDGTVARPAAGSSTTTRAVRRRIPDQGRPAHRGRRRHP